ncbi:MAG TPA: hypothetical protein VFX49_04135 [Chloroflexota bacterium]|nr:hypothetical protein [Chloroflexota bacterium]
MQDALPFIVALVLFVSAVVILANRKPTPKARDRYARWNAQYRPRAIRPTRGTRDPKSPRPRST